MNESHTPAERHTDSAATAMAAATASTSVARAVAPAGSAEVAASPTSVASVPAVASAFAPGKVILLGEHAAVYGEPAIAAALSLGVTAEVRPGTGRLTAPQWNVDVHARRPGDETGPRTSGGAGKGVAEALAAIFDELGVTDVDLLLTGELPARAGLGSSAATSVAIARAIARARHLADQRALAAAARAETIFHGRASGVDLAVASSAGVGRYSRAAGWQPLTIARPFHLCIGLTGGAHETRAHVEAVAALREASPVARRMLELLGDLARDGERAIATGEIDQLGGLFNLAQGLLAGLGVSSARIEGLVHAARDAGALGAKLSGAGGDGAVIALAPGREADVLSAWQRAGFQGFVTTVAMEPGDNGTRREYVNRDDTTRDGVGYHGADNDGSGANT